MEVAQIEEVAQRVWDVFRAWGGVWAGGNVRDLDDPQRRLRWALDRAPDRLKVALPLVEQLANAKWDEFFANADSGETEREIRAELLALRTRVAQGLPVVGRWLVVRDLGEMNAGRRDATAYLWEIRRGQEERQIAVFISGTAMAAGDGLPEEVVAAKNTNGRSVLATIVGLDDPPGEISVTTAGVSFGLSD